MGATGFQRHAGRGPGLIQWVGLGTATVVILGLTFSLGILVGRQWARQTAHPAAAPAAASAETKPGAGPARRSGLAASDLERVPRVQDRLTFYQTLTAPLEPRPAAPTAAPGAPPAEEPRKLSSVATDARAGAEPRSAGLPGRTPAAAAEEPGERWTVQVAALKSPRQAEILKERLVAAGFQATVSQARSDEGRVHFRVRVGSFASREEADRMAARLRAEQSMPTYVTPI